MDLVAVELPALGVPLTREASELRDVFPGRGLSGEILQVMPNKLVQTHALALGNLLSSLGELLVYG
jgi:hypothetical protein